MVRKLNRNYFSFFDLLTMPFKEREELPLPPGYGCRYNDGIEDKPEPIPNYVIAASPKPEDMFYYWHQWWGMLRPIAKTKKDITDITQPYHTRKKFFKDLSQPVSGTFNVLSGLLSFLGGLITTALVIALSPIIACIPTGPRHLLIAGIYTTSWVIRGVLDIIRGLAQIITAPLTFLIKIPARCLITWHQKKQHTLLLAEEKPQIKRLAARALSCLTEIQGKLQALQQELRQEPARKAQSRQELEEMNAKNDALKDLVKQHKNDQKELLKTQAHDEKEVAEMNAKNDALKALVKEYENERTELLKNIVFVEYSVKHPSSALQGARDAYREAIFIVVRILYEINRKLTRSLADGWETGLEQQKVTSQFNDCYPIFSTFFSEKDGAQASKSEIFSGAQAPNSEDFLYKGFADKTERYLANFSA